MTKRIREICSALPRVSVFADVGCDHGYCTRYMFERGLCERAYVTDIGKKYKDEVGLSQLFIAIRPDKFQDPAVSDGAIARVVEDIKNSVPAGEGGISYPGERTLATRRRNLERGIPVLDEVWERIQGLR